jgi:hypothetical protein
MCSKNIETRFHGHTISYPQTFRGRTFCIMILMDAQLLLGVIHIFFGSWFRAASQTTSSFFITTSSASQTKKRRLRKLKAKLLFPCRLNSSATLVICPKNSSSSSKHTTCRFLQLPVQNTLEFSGKR